MSFSFCLGSLARVRRRFFFVPLLLGWAERMRDSDGGGAILCKQYSKSFRSAKHLGIFFQIIFSCIFLPENLVVLDFFLYYSNNLLL